MTERTPVSRADGPDAVIQKVLAEQKDFEERRATVMGQGAERLTAPVSGWIARLIPGRPCVVRTGRRG